MNKWVVAGLIVLVMGVAARGQTEDEVKALREQVELQKKQIQELRDEIKWLRGLLALNNAEPGEMMPGTGATTQEVEAPKKANRVVFICDGSGSMLSQFDHMRSLITSEVRSFGEEVEFSVVMMQAGPLKMSQGKLVPATLENRNAAIEFMRRALPRGVTEPMPAFRAALAMKPEVIWFVTDGDLGDQKKLLDEVKRSNAKQKTRIHCLILGGGEADEVVRGLASGTGGTCRSIGKETQGVFVE